MAMTDEEIIRARLLVDERPLKRLIKRFYTLSSCPIEDLDNNYAQFALELESQEVHSQAKQRTTKVADEEIAVYEHEIARIEQETKEAEQAILDLKQQLLQAQQTRKNKIVYDSITKEALRIPSRAHSAENIARLTAELKELEAEQTRYTETWADRRTAFDAIVKSLEDLGERVREEKSEQERRDALNDDDVPEDGATANGARSGEESDAEGAEVSNALKRSLDPSAKSFEPSPLGLSVLNNASPLPSSGESDGNKAGAPDVVSEAAPSMEVDEDGELQLSELDNTKKKRERSRSRSRSRSPSAKEEGEEEEEAMQS